MMNDDNSNIIVFGVVIATAIILTVCVNMFQSDYSGNNYTKQETFFRLQHRPSKLIK
tara:strand:- start:480 stop:650 length:171 start_codon:yes stop_codon:yes gene_type:complete